MSDLAIARLGGGDTPRLLAPVTLAILLTVGIVSFVATLLLGAYAPDLDQKGTPGGHALSPSSIGFAGLVRLAEATGRHPRILRDARLFGSEDLLIATPPSGTVDVSTLLAERNGTPTLIILPKWRAAADPAHRGWVTVDGLTPGNDPGSMLSPGIPFAIVRHASGGKPLLTLDSTMTGVSFTAPRPLQAIRPTPRLTTKPDPDFGALEPLIVDTRGNIVVGRFTDRPLYILSDPDLLDNRGMRDPRNAASALALLDYMNSNEAEGIAFDVTLNGIAQGASPLKLLFEPPFLATTLTIAAAVLLAALGTLARFGSPRPRARAIAFGKTALVDNTAALVARAGAERRLGSRYVEVIREAAARLFAVPARMRGAALDAYLDRLGKHGCFTGLAAAVAEADDKDTLVSAARALHDWMGERER